MNSVHDRPRGRRHRLLPRPHPLPAAPKPEGNGQPDADKQRSFGRGYAVLAQHAGGEHNTQ